MEKLGGEGTREERIAGGITLLGTVRTAMLAAARTTLRRTKARDVPLPTAVLDRLPDASHVLPQTRKVGDDRDGTLWTGYASAWIHDGTRGFWEHQPGFLNARPRC